jgi:homoserine O-succinyltransferase/O-acetyltransferase
MTDLTVGLINNMPDSAFEATELQFRTLLEAAAGGPVQLRLTGLPEVPRADSAAAHFAAQYWPLEDFMRDPPDAFIVTGTEPLASDLRAEPYWPSLTRLLDWSQSRALPSVWSCLAAHAAVLHLSGIARTRLERKYFGVFEHSVESNHPLMANITAPLATPHSRWNDLPVAELRSSGYTILSEAKDHGANIFMMHRGGAQMVFLQGHPEYQTETLLKEYRRDIGRYVRARQPLYPTLPHAYFPAATVVLLEEFCKRAKADRRPQIMADFPEATVRASLVPTWREGTVQLYRNWLASVRKCYSERHARA